MFLFVSLPLPRTVAFGLCVGKRELVGIYPPNISPDESTNTINLHHSHPMNQISNFSEKQLSAI